MSLYINYGAGSVNIELNAYINSANNIRDYGGHRMYITEIFLFSRRFFCTEKSPYTDSTMPGGQTVQAQSLLTYLAVTTF